VSAMEYRQETSGWCHESLPLRTVTILAQEPAGSTAGSPAQSKPSSAPSWPTSIRTVSTSSCLPSTPRTKCAATR
jgi:hypothetical protein